MCLIIHREKGQGNIDKEFFEDVWDRNDDGWGIVWYNSSGIKIKKGMEFKQFWSIYRGLEQHDMEVWVHMRMRTDGDISLDMCHPFQISDDLYMMHNGVFDMLYAVPKGKSDTWAMIAHHIKPHLDETGKTFQQCVKDQDTLHDILQLYCNRDNCTLTFFDLEGNVTIINEKRWVKTQFGVNVSNTYAYRYGNTKYCTSANEYWWNNIRTPYTSTNYGTSYWNSRSYTRQGSSYIERGNALQPVGNSTSEDLKSYRDLWPENAEPETDTPKVQTLEDDYPLLTEADLDLCVKYYRDNPMELEDLSYDQPNLYDEIIDHVFKSYAN
jgi:predicted glutamine amidotransferase